MSDLAPPLFDPFDLSAPDEETELGGLTASLRLAQGFTLLFARCNQPDQRRRLVAILRERLPHLNIQEIELREPIPHLLDELRYQIAEPTPHVIFVYGLEYSLPIAAQAANTPFVLNLNASRNSFSRYIPCPLVLWTPEYVLTAIMNGAPDFFSVRSGVYFFSADPDYMQAAIQPLVATDQPMTNNMALLEKQERIHDIQKLLQDYQMLGSDRRDYEAEARLLDRLGHLYSVLGVWAEAERCYIETLHIAQRMGYLEGEAANLLNLGSLYAARGQWKEAEDYYAQSFELKQLTNDVVGAAQVLANVGNLKYVRQQYPEAINLFQQSLNMLLPFGSKAVGWQSYNNIGNVYIAQEDWQQAMRLYEQSLQAARELKDKHGEAIVLSNMAGIYSGLQKWQQAEQYCQASLFIARNTGDKRHEARILENLAVICQLQGKRDEAEGYFTASLNVRRMIGDARGEGHVLHSIALLRMENGDIEKAVELAQQATTILKDTEDKNEYTAALDTLEEARKRTLRQHANS